MANLKERFFKYDDKNRLICKIDDCIEVYEYDDHGNMVRSKTSTGFEKYFEYDDKGNLLKVRYPSSPEYIEEYTYDDNGNNLTYEDSDSFERYEYDSNNNLTHSIFIYKNEPDEYGNLLADTQLEEWFEYDGKGQTIHYRNSHGEEQWTDYQRNSVHVLNQEGREEWFYNTPKEEIYKDSMGYERRTEFDEHGNVVYIKDNLGYERRYENTYEDDNLVYIRETW